MSGFASPFTCDTAAVRREREAPTGAGAAQRKCLAFTCSCPLTYIHMSASTRSPLTGRLGIPRSQ